MSISVTPEQMTALRATLLNTSGSTPLHERFRALFMLKAVGGDQVVEIISEGGLLLILKGHSSLFALIGLPSSLSGETDVRPQRPLPSAQT